MIVLENILSQEIVQKLGWTLLHFVWQAAVVALLLAILLKVLRKTSANLRYILACSALGLIVLLPLITIQLVPVSLSLPAAHIEPVPVSPVLPAEAGEEMPAAQTPMLERAAPLEGVGTVSTASWKQRATEFLEPALPYIVLGWLSGVFALSVWHLGGWAQLHRLRRKMLKQVDDTLHSKLSQLAEKLAVNRVVQLMESALVQVPTIVGWLRPVILLPASALSGLSANQLEALLAHELAHIKRFDYLVNILQTVVEILGFYHPAVWWVSHKIRDERENCCDDIAVSVSGDRVRYARALTSMEEIRTGQGQLAVAASGGNLFRRIYRLVGKDSADKTSFSWIPAVTAILLILALVIPTALALTNKSTPLQAEPKRDVQVEENASKVSQFVASLPDGVMIELVGLCEFPSEGKKWWKPDGTELSKEIRVRQRSSCVSATGKLYAVAVKVTMPEDATFKWGGTKGATGGADLEAVDSKGRPISNMQAWMVYIDEKLTATSIQFGVATGPWKTRARNRPKGRMSTPGGGEGGIVFAKAYESGKGVTRTVADGYIKLDHRVIAIGTDDKTHIPDDQSVLSAEKVRQTTVHFQDLKLNQIEYFLFQTRPYGWVEFRNVSLRQGVKTDVQVEDEPDKTFGRRVDNSAFFTPPVTRLVNATGERKDCLIDFDNNKLYSLPPDYYSWSRNQQQVWDRENGIDAGAETAESEEGLWGEEIVVIPVANVDFDRMTPASFRDFLRQATPGTPAIMTTIGQLPKTYLIKTREGGMGLLQILEVQRKQKPNYIKIRYKMVPRTADSDAKITSNKKLQDLGKAMVFFAQDHQRKLPDSLQDFAPYLRNKQDIEWLSQNVEYLGKGKTEKDRPDTIIAYDKSLLKLIQGTNVLFLDAHVEYVQADQLKKLDINSEIEKRVESAKKLSNLDKALLIYANDHEDKYPNSLAELQEYLKDEELKWALTNVKYLAKGKTITVPPNTPIAYDKTPLAEGTGTNVLFNDSHVEFVKTERLKELGIGK